MNDRGFEGLGGMTMVKICWFKLFEDRVGFEFLVRPVGFKFFL